MMEGWKEYRFDEIALFPPKIKMKKGELYPFIPMENLDGGYKYVKPQKEKELKGGGAKFEEGDTLFARITPCLQNGKIAQAKGLGGKPAFGSTEYFVFRGIEGVSDSDFIYYLSKTLRFRGNAENSMVGASGRQRADAGFVRSLKVTIPPLPTQRKIASILSAYDDLIENNLKRIKLLEEKAQLTYEEWFVRLKFPGHETTPINKETGLPEGWEKRPFEDVIDFKEGPGLRNWQYREEGIPFLNIRVIKDGDVDMTKVQFLDPGEVENKYKHFLLEENDHVISSSGTLGRLTTIRKCHLPICLNTSIIRMRSKDEQFGKWLIKHTLLGQIFQSTMEIYANGSAQVNFGPTHLKQIKLPIPSTEIAVRYERIMEPIEEHIKLLRDKNRHLNEARDILLPRLMTGIIDVEQMNTETLQPTTA